jgi:hypothetical protein
MAAQVRLPKQSDPYVQPHMSHQVAGIGVHDAALPVQSARSHEQPGRTTHSDSAVHSEHAVGVPTHPHCASEQHSAHATHAPEQHSPGVVPTVQAAASGLKASAGHAGDVPEHASA